MGLREIRERETSTSSLFEESRRPTLRATRQIPKHFLRENAKKHKKPEASTCTCCTIPYGSSLWVAERGQAVREKLASFNSNFVQLHSARSYVPISHGADGGKFAPPSCKHSGTGTATVSPGCLPRDDNEVLCQISKSCAAHIHVRSS